MVIILHFDWYLFLILNPKSNPKNVIQELIKKNIKEEIIIILFSSVIPTVKLSILTEKPNINGFNNLSVILLSLSIITPINININTMINNILGGIISKLSICSFNR